MPDTNTSLAPASAARSDVNCDAADMVANHFALAGMKSGADPNAQRPDFVGDGASAAHGACLTAEVARTPSPVVLISWPRKRERARRIAVW
ncbi:hypothetical protein LPJ38_17285 [Bradyrhizobium daqingense]|uniref:hypothetical protein n=1 Tax=Bradyrhizobium daqingense TaxID=993502 RepID=UPI001315635C|nr:hypothetical protein [Bradyrhizobium daqingense]UFS92391.1 hypothetical protein LPJ38_17285 [Bradyrhizobium daqingense]